jgi:hypothetical protein
MIIMDDGGQSAPYTTSLLRRNAVANNRDSSKPTQLQHY